MKIELHSSPREPATYRAGNPLTKQWPYPLSYRVLVPATSSIAYVFLSSCIR